MKDTLEIVLVEDNPSDAELILRVFRKHGLAANCILLRDGAEAVDYFFGSASPSQNDKPKVILLDLKLPKINGEEVLRRLRESEQTRHIPVVVLTSSNQERDIQESYELGANSYITKPINFEEFSRVVAELGLYWLTLNRPPMATTF